MTTRTRARRSCLAVPGSSQLGATSVSYSVDTSKVEVHEVDADVNDPAFATAMADRLHELIREARHDA